LESSGVDTVVELATRKAENLLQTLTKVNKEKNKTRRTPNLAEVTGWIQKAKKLPRVLEYSTPPNCLNSCFHGERSG
jgi:hypothetical protein